MNKKSGNDGKTQRLDDEYFKSIAREVQSGKPISDDTKTQIVGGRQNVPEHSVPPASDDRTRIYRSTGEESGTQTNETNAMDDPPVGWLVAVQGPGKGQVLTLGIGSNAVGRGDDIRVPITFNDNQISRGKSFQVIYDGKNRKFYVTQGEGKTLIYLNDMPVLEPTAIISGTQLSIGQTIFRFVSICDSNFDWADTK